jgi:endonuclease VIII
MEGPSIVILVEEAQKFIGERVKECSGSSKVIDPKSLCGQILLDLQSWGKHFLLIFEKQIFRVHFLLFGSYRIDEERPGTGPRLALRFRSGEIFFYACSIRELTEPLASLYDWKIDVMSPEWDEEVVINKLLKKSDVMVCDALLDQEIFGGAGNIIKNEVLFRMQLQPTVKLKLLTKPELRLLSRETRLYTLQFYVWKKQYLLRKNWRIFRKKNCPVCGSGVIQGPTGVRQRRSFFCPLCQKKRRTVPRTKINEKLVTERLARTADQINVLQEELPSITAQSGIEREH